MYDISLSVISSLNEFDLICLLASIAIISTLFNGCNYCSLSLTLIGLFNINPLFAESEVVTSITF